MPRERRQGVMKNKTGFWSVLALVMGSQVGTGAFMVPACLAPFGFGGLQGWLVSGTGAVLLALVFARLCCAFPRTGGPHVFAEAVFGRFAGFVTGWTYWMVSWISTAAVISTMAGFLLPLVGPLSPGGVVMLEWGLLLSFLLVNLRGIVFSGRVELFLSACKVFVFLVIPLVALAFFDPAHAGTRPVQDGTLETPATLTMLTLWCFVGLEAGTTPAGSVERPHITIPRAVVWGTLGVALLYILNSFCMIGALPWQTLASSSAPYADLARMVLGEKGGLVVSALGAFVCMGTMNAWILVSGQVGLGLAEGAFFPTWFSRTNRYGAPYVSLLLSSVGLFPLLLLTARPRLADQVLMIVDVSTAALLWVYGLCACAWLVCWWRDASRTVRGGIAGGGALLFCIWLLVCVDKTVLLQATLLPLAGCLIRAVYARRTKLPDTAVPGG